MNEKLIIENKSSWPLSHVMKYVENVINQPKIIGNNNKYCPATLFSNGVCIHSIKNKKSYKLTVTYSKDFDESGKIKTITK